MLGREDSINKELLGNNLASGIIPKSVKLLFSFLQSLNLASVINVKVSFIEIYNERVNDLLNNNNTNLKIRQGKLGHFVEGTTLVSCNDVDDILEVIVEGVSNRKKGSHYLNNDSSRSHCLLIFYLNNTKNLKSSILTFVDLAGSEKVKDSKVQGAMLKEASNINKSLLTLGKVISLLSDKSTMTRHIPYRDSKLTLLLAHAFGGSSKTLLIGCISASTIYIEESLNTLIFCSKAMNIINKPFIGVRYY